MSNHNNPDVFPDYLRPLDTSQSTPPIPRSYKTAFADDFLKTYHAGTMKYTYRGVSCLKSPIDLAIYMLMINQIQPATIIEIGSYQGGSALFFRDLCRTYQLETEVITVDNRQLGENHSSREGITFIQADAMNLQASPLEEKLLKLNRPILVIEDSAHHRNVTYAVLEYFSHRLNPGEYLIIEDGVIEDQGGSARYGGGPNLAVHDFFVSNPDSFKVDTFYNDFFGRNATFNPNGYLIKL